MQYLKTHGFMLLFLLLIAFIYMGPIFGEGAFIAGDHPFYLAMAHAVNENLWSHQGLIGWSPSDFAGFPLFSPFLPAPIGFLVILLLNSMTSIPIPLLYKLLVFLSFVFPAMALWIVFSKRVHVLAAFTAVNLYLLSTYHLIQPLQGMWAHYLGLGMVILVIHYFDLWLTAQIKIFQAMFLGLLILLAALTDAITWPILLFVVPLSVAFYCRKRQLSGRPIILALLVLFFSFVLIAGWIFFIFSGQMDWGIMHPQNSLGLADLLVRLPAWFLIPGGSEVVLGDILPQFREGKFIQVALLAGQLLGEHLSEGIVVVLFFIGLIFFYTMQKSRIAIYSRSFNMFFLS